MAGVLAASLALRQNGVTPDVSWLTSMCERMLDGERGWIDIFETTPPVPVLLYMPGAWSARVLGVSAEAAVFITAYLASFASLVLTARILPATLSGIGPSRWFIVFPASVFLLVLSHDAFAQREHFAAAFSLPMFAAMIARAETGAWPDVRLRIAAGLLAGLCFAIKPPLFALPFLAFAAVEAARTRSLSFIFPSMLALSAVFGVALTALSLAAFPAYLDGVTTMMHDIYLPVRASAAAIFERLAFFGVAAALAAGSLLRIKGALWPAQLYAAAGAAAFVAADLIQGKYFAYHLLPAGLFALIFLSLSAAPRFPALSARGAGPIAAAGALAVVVAGLSFAGYGDGGRQPGRPSWAEGLNRPTAMAISPSVYTGFPLAEHIGARWVDRIHSQWLLNYARILLSQEGLSAEQRATITRHFDDEVRRTRELIRNARPEIIFQVDYPGTEWFTDVLLEDDPALLDGYEVIGRERSKKILRRKDLIETGARSPVAGGS